MTNRFLDPIVDVVQRAWWWLGDRVPDSWGDRFERFKLRSQQLGLRVQAVVVRVLLAFTYALGMGLTRISAAVFSRRMLGLFDQKLLEGSYWMDAEGYEQDREALLKQY